MEAVLAAAVLALVASGTRGWELAAYTWWAAGLTVLVFIDAAVHRLPHRITAATTSGTLLLLIQAEATPGQWLRAALAGLTVAAVYALIRAASRGGLGLGDVALGLPVGFAAGWHGWAVTGVALFAAHLLAVVAVLLMRMLARRPAAGLPLGPYLAGGALLAVTVLR